MMSEGITRSGTYWPPPPGFDPNLARRGHPKLPLISGVLIAAVFVLSAAMLGSDGPLLLTLSLGPVALMLTAIYYWNKETLTASLVLEQFWTGSVLSIFAASLLEVIFQLQTRKIWACQAHSPDVACDIKFILVVITGVGVVEEVSKVLPMARIHISWLHYLTSHQWWFRLVDAPRPYALMGLYSAAGFAAVENVKYVFSEGVNRGVGTSLWRAALAIPFHLACSTYAAATVASFAFSVPSEDWRLSSGSAAEPAEEAVSQLVPPSAAALPGLAPLLAERPTVPCGYGGRDWRWEPFETLDPNVFVWVVALFVPSLLHGLYDAGLFLAVQFVSHEDETPEAPVALKAALRVFAALRGEKLLTAAAGAGQEDGALAHSLGVEAAYQTLALLCVGSSLVCYLAMLALAYKKFSQLPKSPAL